MNNPDSKRSIGCAADQENIFVAKETPFLDTSIDASDLFQAASSMAYLRHLLKVFHIIIVAASPTCRGDDDDDDFN